MEVQESVGGRIIFIRHVLSSLPIHLLSVMPVPRKVIDTLERCFADFLWGSPCLANADIGWLVLCKPTHEGGIGVRSLQDVSVSLRLKQCWKVHNGIGIWANYVNAKYCSSSS